MPFAFTQQGREGMMLEAIGWSMTWGWTLLFKLVSAPRWLDEWANRKTLDI